MNFVWLIFTNVQNSNPWSGIITDFDILYMSLKIRTPTITAVAIAVTRVAKSTIFNLFY